MVPLRFNPDYVSNCCRPSIVECSQVLNLPVETKRNSNQQVSGAIPETPLRFERGVSLRFEPAGGWGGPWHRIVLVTCCWFFSWLGTVAETTGVNGQTAGDHHGFHERGATFSSVFFRHFVGHLLSILCSKCSNAFCCFVGQCSLTVCLLAWCFVIGRGVL